MSKIKDILYKDISLFKMLEHITFDTKGLAKPLIIMLLTMVISKAFIGLNAIFISIVLDGKVTGFNGSELINLLVGALGVGYLFILYKLVESICMPIVMWTNQTADTIVESEKVDRAVNILMKLPLKYWQDVDESELSLRLNVNQAMRHIFFLIYRNLLPAIVELVIALVALFLLGTIFEPILVGIVSLVYIAIMTFWVPKLTKKFLHHIKAEGKMSKFILEMFEVSRLVKSYGTQKIFINKYKEELASENKAFEERVVALSFAEVIPSLLLAVSLSTIFISLCFKLESGAITVGVFSATMAVATAVLANLKSLLFVFAAIHDVSPKASFPFLVIETFEDKLKESLAINNQVNAGILKVNNLKVLIKDKEILKGINFEIKEGEKVWLVGESGAGKSVLLSTLSGLKSKVGEVYVGERLIEDEQVFAFVPQGLGIVLGSIKFNLLIGNQNASEGKMWEVLDSVGLRKCVEEKGGLDTEVTLENFSGGELQKLSIARAIISDRPIILMDEPTSALDVYSEKLLVETIVKIKSSCLISIHRLHAIPPNSRVLVLKDGVIEKDTVIEEVLKK